MKTKLHVNGKKIGGLKCYDMVAEHTSKNSEHWEKEIAKLAPWSISGRYLVCPDDGIPMKLYMRRLGIHYFKSDEYGIVLSINADRIEDNASDQMHKMKYGEAIILKKLNP